jgi:hypothetical protein
MALIFPDALTVAIDIDEAGVRRTNELIAANRLPAKAVVARSPEGIAGVVAEHLSGAVDFSLIDAVHNNEAVIADFAAVTAVAAEGACHLFHDVINWHMIDGFNQVLATHRLSGKVFTRTPSGMALAYSRLSPEFEAYLDCFTEPPELYRKLRQLCLATFVDPIAAFQTGYRA